MEIRPMKKEDAEEVGGIYVASWKAAYRGILPQGYLDRLSGQRWSFLGDDPSGSYLLINQGRCIGTSSIRSAGDREMHGWGEIVSLYLLPECFGKGYGRILFEFDIRELNRAGYRNIYLWTLQKNQRARAFYEKFGFIHDRKTVSCEIGGEQVTEVRYIYTNQNGKTGDIR